MGTGEEEEEKEKWASLGNPSPSVLDAQRLTAMRTAFDLQQLILFPFSAWPGFVFIMMRLIAPNSQSPLFFQNTSTILHQRATAMKC